MIVSKSLKDTMIKVTKDVMEKARGVQSSRISQFDFDGFFTTCLATSKLGIRDTQLGGFRLSDYKLDPRLAVFVMPRGVYIDQSLHSLNVMVPIEVQDESILSPQSFIEVQSDIIGALRSSDNLSVDLEQASESVMLPNVTDRISKEGMIHDKGSVFLPLEITLNLYRDSYYNYDAEDCIREFIRQKLLELK